MKGPVPSKTHGRRLTWRGYPVENKSYPVENTVSHKSGKAIMIDCLVHQV